MLTASVAAAIKSDSFSKSVTHITPPEGSKPTFTSRRIHYSTSFPHRKAQNGADIRLLSPTSMFLLDGQCPPKSSRERLFVQTSPVLFMRRRVDGLAKFADGMLDHTDATGYVPHRCGRLRGCMRNACLRNVRRRVRRSGLPHWAGRIPMTNA